MGAYGKKFTRRTRDKRNDLRVPGSLCAAATLVLTLLCGPAGVGCWRDVVDGRKGNMLAMRSGMIYQVLDNAVRRTFWLPLTRVSICEQFANVNGAVAVLYEIRNQDRAEMITAARTR
jgi:hypothetical protein